MDSAVGKSNAISPEELKGFCVVADACVAGIGERRREGGAHPHRRGGCGAGRRRVRRRGCAGPSDLEQRYYDRFFVSSHPAYVPLYEDSIRSGYPDEGRFRYGTTEGRWYEHTLKCYQAVGFDYRLIEGHDLSVQKLKPRFVRLRAGVPFVSGGIRRLIDGSRGIRARSEELFVSFAGGDPRSMVRKGCGLGLERFEDDFYARVCRLAADTVAAIVG